MITAAPIHPGEHLAEILGELRISRYRLAKAIRCPSNTHQRHRSLPRSVTAGIALRVGKALGLPPSSV